MSVPTTRQPATAPSPVTTRGPAAEEPVAEVELPGLPRERSLTLERGLALLQAVAEAQSDAPTISELAAAIRVSRAAVYRLLGPLQARGLVRREGSRVRLGLGLLTLAGNVLPQVRLAALPALRELAERTGATAHITVADGEEAQVVAVVEPTWTVFHVSYRVGYRHPARQGAAGRAIDLSADRHWVFSSGEIQEGAYGVAAPVRGVTGLRASVGVVAMRPVDEATVGPLTVTAAEAVSAALT
ncbi:IclR family transcriptional regulator [Actinoalloteichus caeruleus]|uniref:IclR family transcriptional regulator n=1 Tax=Actinoalloteichus cyanogriseus TaxID=2893586 RepID=UPI003BB86BA9